ncbi:MAG: DUF4278 domain-containing protein [Nodosilinea sp.]
MKLTYRGVSYDYTPPTVEFTPSNEVGKFRGLDIRFRALKKAPVQQPTLDLVYRGVAYSTHPAQPSVSQAVMAAPTPVQTVEAGLVKTEARARLMMMNRHRSVKQRQQSMLTRLAAEAGLATGASAYWNHIQGKVHPSFWATYSRSAAAVS